MTKEVIIMGCGPTHVESKYHCETWGVNGVYTFSKRLDKLFFADEESEVNSAWYDIPKIMSFENLTCVFPIKYKRFSDLGLNIEVFPLELIQKKFPTEFFSNTIAYMLAYALYYDYEKIWLYGIDMMSNTTYIQEKGGVEFWMGVALGMSAERVKQGKTPIEIVNTMGSATGKTWNGLMYGYWGELQNKENEKLLMPFEMTRISKQAKPQSEWILGNDGEYHAHKMDKKGEYDLQKDLIK